VVWLLQHAKALCSELINARQRLGPELGRVVVLVWKFSIPSSTRGPVSS